MELDFLKSTALFKGMDDGEIELALDRLGSRERSFKKGELILSAGACTDSLGLVLEGSATIESGDIWGSRTILSHVGAGQFFAETYAVLGNEPLLVDVCANEDSRILFFRIGNLSGTAPWSVKLLRNILMISVRKNLHLSGRSFHTAPKTARGRISAYLRSVSLQKQSNEFDIPFDRQQLADYLNLDRSALSKELGRMRDDGIISFRKNHFVIN